jgi:hypothetical protein
MRGRFKRPVESKTMVQHSWKQRKSLRQENHSLGTKAFASSLFQPRGRVSLVLADIRKGVVEFAVFTDFSYSFLHLSSIE